jgi:hypothetical protein
MVGCMGNGKLIKAETLLFHSTQDCGPRTAALGSKNGTSLHLQEEHEVSKPHPHPRCTTHTHMYTHTHTPSRHPDSRYISLSRSSTPCSQTCRLWPDTS